MQLGNPMNSMKWLSGSYRLLDQHPIILGCQFGRWFGVPPKKLWWVVTTHPREDPHKNKPRMICIIWEMFIACYFYIPYGGKCKMLQSDKTSWEREREGEEDEACYWMEGGWWTQRLREIRIKPFLRKHDFQKLKFEGIFWISSKSGFILRCTVMWGKISVVWRPWPTKKQGILIQISSPVKPPCF